MTELKKIDFTLEELDRQAVITDTDLAIAHSDIAKFLSAKYKNLLMATEADVDNAFTGQSEA